MDSCIYEGRVRHTRKSPAIHRFNYRLFMMYLDLDELSTLFSKHRLWSVTRPAVARFRRSDHLGPEKQPLKESVKDLVEAETGVRPGGPVRLLTNLSYFGYCFNPVSFYYCFAADGEKIEYIVAEVSNTPWGECDTYVLDCKDGPNASRSWQFQPEKKMHVSPFIPMQIEYRWVLSAPTDRLSVFMANSRQGERFFSASISLQRTPINCWSLASVLTRFPFMTFKIIGAIYWEALRLWIKRVPFHTHPDKKKEVTAQ